MPSKGFRPFPWAGNMWFHLLTIFLLAHITVTVSQQIQPNVPPTPLPHRVASPQSMGYHAPHAEPIHSAQSPEQPHPIHIQQPANAGGAPKQGPPPIPQPVPRHGNGDLHQNSHHPSDSGAHPQPVDHRQPAGSADPSARAPQPPSADHQEGPMSLYDLSDQEYNEYNKEHFLEDPGFDPRSDMNESDPDHDEFVHLWAQHMDGFIPDTVLTFNLPAHSNEFIYQQVGPNATLIRGGFIVEGDNVTGTEVTIYDTRNEVIYRSHNIEDIFHFNTTAAGVYTVQMANTQRLGSRTITFLMGVGYDTSLKAEDLRDFNKNVVKVVKMAHDSHSESQYLWGRQKAQMARVEGSLSRFLWLSLGELVIIILLGVFQIHYLKALVANRRLF